MARLSYHWLAQGVIVALCFVQFTVSEIHTRTYCYFYPIHGVIHNWYNQNNFQQPQHYYPYQHNGISIFGKRSSIQVLSCQYTGHYRYDGGRHYILVYCHNHVGIWVDVTAGHCGSQDCCHSGQHMYNYCASNPCQNGGSCSIGNTGYMCHCPTGSHGSRCEYVVNHCASNPCMHGLCSNNVTDYTCACDVGYTGYDCDIHVLIDHCAKDPCVHGICQNGLTQFSCVCNIGYMGTTCSQLINHCATDPCVHGICRNGLTQFSCLCYNGYIGTTCSQPIQTTTDKSTQAFLISTYRSTQALLTTTESTQALLTTTERSTQPLLTTTERSTQVIVTATAKLCMDDQLFNCQNQDICKSKFRDNCPLSCGICVPDPVTTKKPCVDNIFLKCQDHSICSSKLSQYCPVTCGICDAYATTQSQVHGAAQTTQSSTERGAVQHTCNKFGLLMDLAMGKALHQQSTKDCGGNSSDAVVIKHCQAPSFSKWRKGFEVTSNCSHINHYTPVAEWNSQGFTDNIGVMTFCHSGVIEMMSQTCDGQMVLKNITSPASKSFYTVDWA